MGGIGGIGILAGLFDKLPFWQIIILTVLIGVIFLCAKFFDKNPNIIRELSAYKRERYEEREHLAIKKKEFSRKVAARKKGNGS